MNLNDFFLCFRDFKVVMMNINDDANKMKYFDGHQAPILSLNVYEEKRWIVTIEFSPIEMKLICFSGHIVL